MIKFTLKPRDVHGKMGPEELQNFLKAKRQGNGSNKSKKDYNRKQKHKNIV
jgi:hypothetical protein